MSGPRPRSLRGRLVLIAGVLATGVVLLCQLAGLAVVRDWLTAQVDARLAHFRPPPQVYPGTTGADGPPPPGPDGALPSDYRVFFYDRDGNLLASSLSSADGGRPGPRLPPREADLTLAEGRPATLPSEGGGRASGWRAVSYQGPDRMRAVVALPLDAVDGVTTKLLWFSLGLGGVVAAGVVLLGNGAVRLGLRPLTRVEHTAQRITAGALELNVPVADPDTEVGRLGLALNTMLDRLRTALHRTEASEARLRHFMADAGHELRTPLTAIQGFAELLLEAPELTADRRREAHTLIAHNADRMSRLVDDLFLLAKLGAAPVVHREPVDLLSLAADAIATTAIRHPRRIITLEPLPTPSTAADSDLDIVETPGDPHQLAQILGNLLSNAVTHTPPTGRIRVRVGATRATADPHPGRGPLPPPGTPVCVVEVADEGPGIDPADAPRIFDRFYRADPTPEPGTGLGLAIAAAIATAHGGRLELDTHPTRGSTFRLLLPPAPEPH